MASLMAAVHVPLASFPGSKIKSRSGCTRSCHLAQGARQPARRPLVTCQAGASEPPPPQQAAPAAARSSLICPDCEGDGNVECKQCKGGGVNLEDHFQGRFKAGTTCWLCRGKKFVLCGNCNGAGFLGGFLNAED